MNHERYSDFRNYHRPYASGGADSIRVLFDSHGNRRSADGEGLFYLSLRFESVATNRVIAAGHGAGIADAAVKGQLRDLNLMLGCKELLLISSGLEHRLVSGQNAQQAGHAVSGRLMGKRNYVGDKIVQFA